MSSSNSVVEPRYRVVEGSQSMHCCFDFTVVDTSRPEMINGEHYRGQYEPVCECFTEADAVLICRALNAFDPKTGESQGG